jgi:hypothetical protein
MLLVGCGGANPPASLPGTDMSPPGRAHAGSVQFRVEGGDNSVQDFGQEGSRFERQAAAIALHGFLEARAAREWQKACSELSGSVRRSLADLAGQLGRRSGCAGGLAATSASLSGPALARTEVADVGALRVRGNRGFLLYYGAGKVPYGLLVLKESGAWRLGAVSALQLG